MSNRSHSLTYRFVGVFITVFLIAIVTINYLGIRFFGEIEFWLSTVKVLTILGLILLGIIIAAGGVPGSPATGTSVTRRATSLPPSHLGIQDLC